MRPCFRTWSRDILGLPADRIELRYNDIAMPKLAGTGSFGSRSLISHGAALATGAKEIMRKAQDLAAKELEVAPADLTFENGQYRVAGTDLSIEPAVDHLSRNTPAEVAHPLDTSVGIDTATAFPSGAHVAEVEIDPDTGALADRQLCRRRRLRHGLQSRPRRGPVAAAA